MNNRNSNYHDNKNDNADLSRNVLNTLAPIFHGVPGTCAVSMASSSRAARSPARGNRLFPTALSLRQERFLHWLHVYIHMCE